MTVTVQPGRLASPLAVYRTALKNATTGGGSDLTAIDPAGNTRNFVTGTWCGQPVAGDEGLLRRCAGPVLDVGCGPGRLTSAVRVAGHVALGIDISPEAIRLARRRGAPAVRRDVYAALPGEGQWRCVLLADGNIGIGGDPQRLLRRCRQLSAADGQVLVEVDPPGAPTWAGQLRIVAAGGMPSTPFAWAYVGVDDLGAFARQAGLRLLEHWTEAGRWFASLVPS